MNKSKNIGKVTILGKKLFLLSVLVLTLSIINFKKDYLLNLIRSKVVTKEEKREIQKAETEFKNLQEKLDASKWDDYWHQEYGISFKVPPDLLKDKKYNEYGYTYFVTMQENKFSDPIYKGVAVGFTQRSVTEEENFIKTEIQKSIPDYKYKEELKLVRSAIKIGEWEATKLEYPKFWVYEERTILIFNNGKITISISTTPKQMETIIKTMKTI